MNQIDVLYTANHRYLKNALASILSLYRNASFNRSKGFKVFLITEHLTIDDEKLINDVMNLCQDIQFYRYSLDSYPIANYQIPDWQGTQIANARLFFQDILGRDAYDIDRLLYLDSDTIVVGDLSELHSFDSPICAVPDVLPVQYAQSLNLSSYYNSGVLLFDVQNWIRQNFQEQLIDYIHSHILKDLKYPDQDLLNIVFQPYLSNLPFSYNVHSSIGALDPPFLKIFCQKKGLSYEALSFAKENPKILHSTAFFDIKPWTNNRIHPYASVFQTYLYQVDSNYLPDQLSGVRGILAQHPTLFYLLYYTNLLIPSNFHTKYYGTLPPERDNDANNSKCLKLK